MYVEYQCFNKILTSEVKKDIFKAIDCGISGISVPQVYVSKIINFMPEGMVISCPIDYPNGFADTDLRIHYCTKAIRNGVNSIDLIANTFLYYNNKEEFKKDIVSIKTLCSDRGVSLRIMIDYKSLASAEDFLPMLSLIKSTGIEFLFCSNGLFSEDATDNILLCRLAQEHYGFKCIANGNFYLPKHFSRTSQANIFGVRFSNYSALRRCVSVYNLVEDLGLKEEE